MSATKATAAGEFDALRADIWQLVSGEWASETELIQQLLDKVGPALGVSRACYNERRGRSIVCTIEWCEEGTKPSIDTRLPKRLVEYFVRDGHCEMFKESALERVPLPLRRASSSLMDRFTKKLNLTSVFAVPRWTEDGHLEGLLTFDVCADREAKPEWTAERKAVVLDATEIVSYALAQGQSERQAQKTQRALRRSVKDRTEELSETNAKLNLEIKRRTRAHAKLEKMLHEKEVLLTEIQHRVKNNLQIVDSLLSLQAAAVDNARTSDMLTESRNRVRSMALIHENLYESQNFAEINFKEYAESLVAHLFRSYGAEESNAELRMDVGKVYLDPNTAILCGLIVNELVSNSLKHAFAAKRKGHVYLSLKKSGDKHTLIVGDTGVGLPKAAETKSKRLGLQLVGMLSEQLGAKLVVSRAKGTEFKIHFTRSDDRPEVGT